jgi:hypothetical protein
MNVENCLTTGSSIVASNTAASNSLIRPIASLAANAANEPNPLKLPANEASTNGLYHHETNGCQSQTNSLKTKLNDDSSYLGILHYLKEIQIF